MASGGGSPPTVWCTATTVGTDPGGVGSGAAAPPTGGVLRQPCWEWELSIVKRGLGKQPLNDRPPTGWCYGNRPSTVVRFGSNLVGATGPFAVVRFGSDLGGVSWFGVGGSLPMITSRRADSSSYVSPSCRAIVARSNTPLSRRVLPSHGLRKYPGKYIRGVT